MQQAIKYFKKLYNDLAASGAVFFMGGGCCRNYFMNVPYQDWNDIDIWFKTEQDKETFLEWMLQNGGFVSFSDASNTMVKYKEKWYDLHHSWYGSIQRHQSMVEITVNACFFDGEQFYYPSDFFQHLVTKKIVWHSFNGYYFELALLRITKMVKKGFDIDRDEIKRIAKGLEKNRDEYVKRQQLQNA